VDIHIHTVAYGHTNIHLWRYIFILLHMGTHIHICNMNMQCLPTITWSLDDFPDFWGSFLEKRPARIGLVLEYHTHMTWYSIIVSVPYVSTCVCVCVCVCLYVCVGWWGNPTRFCVFVWCVYKCSCIAKKCLPDIERTHTHTHLCSIEVSTWYRTHTHTHKHTNLYSTEVCA